MLNQARLKVLKVREDHVRNVLDDARKRLGEITRDQGRYTEILKLLITQGLFQVLLQPHATVVLFAFKNHIFTFILLLAPRE